MDRLRSTLAAPGGARLIGALVALVGVVLLVVGVVALGGGLRVVRGRAGAVAVRGHLPGDAVACVRLAVGQQVRHHHRAAHDGRPAAAAELDTVPADHGRPGAADRAEQLDDPGLADRAAGEVQNRGWQVAQVGNFGGRLAATTVYYTPGDGAGQAAANELAREFPQIDQVLPRYAGLPPTPAGIVLVVTKDW